jgi:hypothetical protein
MARPTIPPQVLAARGVPVRLIDGQEVRICYTFHSLLVLEEKHGGLQGAMAALSDASNAQFASIAGLLAAGLEHEVAIADGTGLGNPEYLSYLIDPMEITTYAAAMGEAFKRSFPQPKEADAGDPQSQNHSPGQSGSTSAPSTSAGPSTSSGV